MIKITQRADFDAVMAAGVSASTQHFALHIHRTILQRRIGAVVPKRRAKKAVTRNTIKRQIYAFAGQYPGLTEAADMVVRLRKTFLRTKYISASSRVLKKAVRTELQQLFDKAKHSP
ncbi:MAG: ribonuclease P protein component [Limnohabitans sp.]|nr:ribonuclease P protein component [Limnohabitans sp.]